MKKVKSLKVRLTLLTAGILILVCALSVLLSNLFLTRYYYYSKEKSLQNAYTSVSRIYLNGLEGADGSKYQPETGQTADEDDILKQFNEAASSTLSDDLELKLDKLSINNNFSILVYRNISALLPDYTISSSTRLLLYSSLGSGFENNVESSNIYSDYVNSGEAAKTVKQSSGDNNDYMIKSVNVKRLGSNYIYLDGTFYNGDKILIRSAVAGINESVRWSNRFFSYLAVLVLILGCFIVYWAASRFMKPITELTAMSRRMAKLDFTAKYRGNSDDEIGILGSSLNVLSESLEEALGELKEANAQLKRDLAHREEIDDMRKEFLSNVSHELKTPIALIQGYAEGLIDNVNEDEESRQFYCDVIVDEAKKMNNMVKQIMALNELESGFSKISMENFDAAELISGLLDKSAILIENNKAQLHYQPGPGPVFVWSDPFLVEEVFTNYLTNALHHLDGERNVIISIDKEQDKVKVNVFNNGKPIPEEDIDRIWDKFYKVDKARTRQYGGSGVGLSIVRAIMDRLGQQCGVKNEENGVSFWFTLDGSDTAGQADGS